MPVIFRELNDLPTPESIFILVDLLPKVTAPLEIVLVDVEVVRLSKAAQRGWGQRYPVRSTVDGKLRRDRSHRQGIVSPPLGKERFHLGMFGTVGGLSLLRSPQRAPYL